MLAFSVCRPCSSVGADTRSLPGRCMIPRTHQRSLDCFPFLGQDLFAWAPLQILPEDFLAPRTYEHTSLLTVVRGLVVRWRVPPDLMYAASNYLTV